MGFLERFILADSGVDFAVHQLLGGHALAKLLASSVRAQVRRIWTILPSDVNPERLEDFNVGGICRHDVSVEEVSESVLSILANEKKAVWILEDNIRNPSENMDDNAIGGITVPFLSDNQLYQMLKRDHVDAPSIRETFRSGGAYPFLGFVALLDPVTEMNVASHWISEEELSWIASRITYVFVGAYDEESYLVLEIGQPS